MAPANMGSKYNVFTGTTTGLVKGILVDRIESDIKIKVTNCVKDRISNEDEITFLNWYDENEEDILIGMKGKFKIYNTKEESSREFSFNLEDAVCGICSYNKTLIFGLESGVIRSWEYPYQPDDYNDLKIIGNNLSRMRQCITNPHIIATGGKENDLKTWDLNTKQNVFNAKNIKPDDLQLAVPIWVSDICFFDNSDKIAYCSRHGHVRIFDPLLPQRRPVVNAHLPEEVFTCMSTSPRDYQLLVGSGAGNLHLVDIRGKGLFVSKYKGFAGAVKMVLCIGNEDSLVISASLDRHLRIHHFQKRTLLIKEYMQSRLTTLLARQNQHS